MPGFLIQQGATVMCAHGGQATPLIPNPAVTLQGMPSCVLAGAWIVAGCPGIVASGILPCVSVQWLTGTTRVSSNGQPLLMQASTACSLSNGTPLLPALVTQTRVSAI
jgi:hypothetical protein